MTQDTPAPTPAAWVTLREASRRTGISYAVVYRHVKQNLVASCYTNDGKYLISEADLPLIERHEAPEDRRRVPVQLVPKPERHAAWKVIADSWGITVTELAYRLLDNRAGYVNPERKKKPKASG